MMFAPMHIQVNNHPYAAINVHNVTYPIWTSLNESGLPFVYLGNGDFSVAGKNVQGVVQGGNSYIDWEALGLTATNVNGMWDFVKPTPIATPFIDIVAKIPFFDTNDEIWFQLPDGHGGQYSPVILDTGSFETAFPADMGTGFPNDGSTTTAGIGGTSIGFNSTYTFELGTTVYTEPCIVEGNNDIQYPLFGYKNLEDLGLSLNIDRTNHLLIFYKTK